jgi:hypothetical protein
MEERTSALRPLEQFSGDADKELNGIGGVGGDRSAGAFERPSAGLPTVV